MEHAPGACSVLLCSAVHSTPGCVPCDGTWCGSGCAWLCSAVPRRVFCSLGAANASSAHPPVFSLHTAPPPTHPQAYNLLTSIRPCGPKKEAIRGATYDLMSGRPADQFPREREEAWTALPEPDKLALQWRMLRNH